jgi:hypothetical protein
MLLFTNCVSLIVQYKLKPRSQGNSTDSHAEDYGTCTEIKRPGGLPLPVRVIQPVRGSPAL